MSTNLVQGARARCLNLDTLKVLYPRAQMLVCDDGVVGFFFNLHDKVPTPEQYASVRMGELILISQARDLRDLKEVLSP